jgi:hypothetical protein
MIGPIRPIKPMEVPLELIHVPIQSPMLEKEESE